MIRATAFTCCLFVVQPVFCGDAPGESCGELGGGAPLLNSQRIERCFGDYSVEVLDGGAPFRVARLSGGGEMQTLAVTRFATPVHSSLAAPMAAIQSGASIGATLREAGWKVAKRNRCQSSAPVALHVYELLVARDEVLLPVATIAEFHSSGYLELEDLRNLYGWAAPCEPPPPGQQHFVRRATEIYLRRK